MASISLLGQLYQACIKGDIPLMKSLLCNNSKDQVDVCMPYNIKNIYTDIPDTILTRNNSHFLEASVLSNQCQVVDFAISQLGIQYTDDDQIKNFWKGRVAFGTIGLALIMNRFDIIHHLINQYGVRFNNFNDDYIISILSALMSCNNYESLTFFLSNCTKAQTLLHTQTESTTLFDYPVFHKDTKMINYLINNGVKVDSIYYNDHTALHYYAKQNDWEMVKFLINEHHANFDIQRCSCRACPTSLLHAALNDSNISIELINYFIELGVDLEIGCQSYQATVLLRAISSGQLQLVQNFIEKGANIHAIDGDKDTLYHYAARSSRCNLPLIKYVHQLGLNPNQPNRYSSTPLQLLINSSFEVVQYVIDNSDMIGIPQYNNQGEIIDYDVSEIIYKAVSANDEYMMDYLLQALTKQFQSINQQLSQSIIQTALIKSIRLCNCHISTLLFKKYLTNPTFSYNNQNLLHHVVSVQPFQSNLFLQFLDIDGIDLEQGRPYSVLTTAAIHLIPLHYIKLLISRGAIITPTSAVGQTILHTILYNHTRCTLSQARTIYEIFDYFLSLGLSTESKLSDQTLLHIVSQHPTKSMITKLLCEKYRADVDVVDPSKYSALHFASKCGSYESVSSLIAAHANLNLTTNRDKTALIIACEEKQWQICNLLLAFGSSIHLSGQHYTFMHLLSKNMPTYSLSADYIRLLQSVHAIKNDINTKNENGFTPIHSAITNSIPAVSSIIELIQWFVDHHGDITILDNKHKTVIHLAVTSNPDILPRLLEYIISLIYDNKF